MLKKQSKRQGAGKWLVIGLPYLWLLLFFALPFLILLRISVTNVGADGGPFAPLYTMVDDAMH